LAEDGKFADGYDAIFGNKGGGAKPAAQAAKKPAAKKPAAKAAKKPAKKK
jgi:hypothetical protein